MIPLIFYEKPGCLGNQQQKVLLNGQGITLDVRNLLDRPWTRETLRPFFNFEPVSEWFNMSAPAIKEGWVDVNELDEYQALNLMLKDPLFIRRPLMEFEDKRQAGFYQGPVLAELGISLNQESDLQSCPMESDETVCEAIG